MAFEEMLNELGRRRTKALAMGGPHKLAKRREMGVLNARERLDYLLDQGSFSESGLFTVSSRPEMRERTPADGKVAGFGRIDGRDVAIMANDFTVLGASSSTINMKKIKHVKQVANKRGLPLIFLGESSGSRMPDRMGASGRATIAQDPTEYQRFRESPWVSALLGSCYGSSTWYAAMSDFVVMRKGSTMAMASARVTSVAIGRPIEPEDLGGWRVHAEKSGMVDLAVDTDQQALDAVRHFLSYLPSHRNALPPEEPVPAGSDEGCSRILEIVPESRTKVYDVRKVIAAIVDLGTQFEIKSRFGRSVVTSLARLNGKTVGIVANNPLHKGGALDVDACNKVTSFMVLCDSFNVPLIFFVDVPGFLIGPEGEVRGAAAKVINWMNAMTQVTVPKLAVIMRKSYGQAYINMAGGRNADEVAIWPTADLGFMDPQVGAHVLDAGKHKDTQQRDETIDRISQDTSAWALAELYEAQTVLDPRDTRQYLIRTLAVHRQRLSGGLSEHRLSNWPTGF